MKGAAVRPHATGVRLLSQDLKITPLHAAHLEAGGKMVEFGGYELPVQYRDGVLKEHLWTREHAGAFDVSHMGPCFLTLNEKTGDADADHAAVSAIIETLVCGDIRGLKPGQIRYTLMLNEQGGMIDDLMVARPVWPSRQGMLYIVVNAGTKEGDFALIEKAAAGRATLTRADDRALIALQGPEAVYVLSEILPEAAELTFMHHRRIDHEGFGLVVARSGYTGEDGFEILIPQPIAMEFWGRLSADERVKPIGLGARDSLRLEAGLPLYAGDFPGAARIVAERENGAARIRVGLRVLEGAPAREGAPIADADGAVIGVVTSGGFSPSMSAPIAMGFVPPAFAEPGTALKVLVRGKPQAAEVTALPFVLHRYVRNV